MLLLFSCTLDYKHKCTPVFLLHFLSNNKSSKVTKCIFVLSEREPASLQCNNDDVTQVTVESMYIYSTRQQLLRFQLLVCCFFSADVFDEKKSIKHVFNCKVLTSPYSLLSYNRLSYLQSSYTATSQWWQVKRIFVTYLIWFIVSWVFLPQTFAFM